MKSLFALLTRRAQTPIESRDYGKIYLVLSGLLFLGTMWSVVDEVFTRRPWKQYQEEYYALSSQKWREKLAEAVASFDSSALVQVQAEISEAEAKLNSPEYIQATRELKELDDQLLDLNRDFTFAKSLQDEAYYFWKKSIHDGNEDKSWKEKYERYEKKKDAANAEIAKRESRKKELSAVMNSFLQVRKQALARRIDLYASIEKAKTKITQAETSPIGIRQVLMDNFDRSNFGIPKARVDRCQTCHAGWNDDLMEGPDIPPVFRRHPLPELLKIHKPELIGCTPCHQGQGPALTEGFAHGSEDHYWEWPLLKDNDVYSSCNKCHSNELYLKYAEPLNKAKMTLVEAGCYGCHEIQGYTALPKIGPELNQLTAKTTPDWIFRWVRNPKDYNPHTRMPNFKFSDDEAEAITAFLWNVGQGSSYRPAKGATRMGSALRGKMLVETIGCKGCHVIGDDPRMRDVRGTSYDIAPELTRVGSKVNTDWLSEWLKNPRHYRPETRMPSLRLTDEEAQDVAAFLATLKDTRRFEEKPLALTSPDVIKRGEKLVREYGCYGCHAIQGMEKEGRVSVALSNIGRKRIDEIDFGDTKIPHTWDDWIFNKVKNARVYATDLIVSKMPVFAFADSEIVLLRTLLRSFTKEEPGEIYQRPYDKREQLIDAGRLLTLNYHCTNCHVVEETGGFIKATLDDEGLAPPLLRPEGAKVQEMWLHDFLKGPTTVRPWLKVRMPTFSLTDDEIATVTNYFLGIQGKDLEIRDYRSFQPDPKFVSAGKKIFDEFQCLGCHFTGIIPEGKTPSDLAPNLTMARGRLKPDWILDWIANPEAIQPGTRMPSYFPDMQSPDPAILGGDAKEQIKALRDYVLSIGK